MSDNSAYAEPQQHFPQLWYNVASLLRLHLAELRIDNDDAEVIADDLLSRCANIEPTMPADPGSAVHRSFGALMTDAITAEQRLFAAQYGRMPGELLGTWPATAITGHTHPFLIAVSKVVSEIEAEANCAEGGKQMN